MKSQKIEVVMSQNKSYCNTIRPVGGAKMRQDEASFSFYCAINFRGFF